MIAAVARGGVIGRRGDLPWRLPRDSRRFRRETTGHALLMGRLTWESIGVPLPKRTSIVISSRADLEVPDEVIVVASLDEAIEAARDRGIERAFVGGGAGIYREGLARADRLVLTRVLAEVDGDVRVPELEPEALAERFERTECEHHPADEDHAYAMDFEEWRPRHGTG